MKRKKKNGKKEEMAYAKISFSFYMTEHEAKEVLNNPKGQIARKMRKYAYAVVKEAASRFFKNDTKDEQNSVTDCKEIEDKA